MTAVAGLGLITVNALVQERERDERREGERRERTCLLYTSDAADE